MRNVNPTAVVLVAITTVIGALCGTVLFGLLVGLLIVFLASVLD